MFAPHQTGAAGTTRTSDPFRHDPITETEEFARALNGARLLDRYARMADSPFARWRERIDRDNLDIADPDLCMLGQLGSFNRLSKTLGLDDDKFEGEDYGFYDPNESAYPVLTAAWKYIIEHNIT